MDCLGFLGHKHIVESKRKSGEILRNYLILCKISPESPKAIEIAAVFTAGDRGLTVLNRIPGCEKRCYIHSRFLVGNWVGKSGFFHGF